ncbi:hypothetical protein NDU88_007743 [Pleurodeles waltl]|uniref:Uncharacterized protein n=1 Tax=Pleurodeles waltl TaxID=8319 RepID=A0AAV7RTQ1_PLEWA|nr:hypothetical protein NDU88_007743 [Pleurodeles waltl]
MAYLSGCNQTHVPEQHGLALEGQRLGRPADFSVPVEVRAPPAHRVEERAQSGAVRPTSRETSVHEFESFDHVLRDTRGIPASQSASTGLVPKDETTVQAVSAPKTSGQAVQGDRLSSRREVAGGLRRGCVSGPDGSCSVWIVGHSFVRWAEKQAASRHFGTQLDLDGARIRVIWVGKSGMRWDPTTFRHCP